MKMRFNGRWLMQQGLSCLRFGRTAELPIPGVNHTEGRCVVAAHRRTQDVRCQTTRVHSLVRTFIFLKS